MNNHTKRMVMEIPTPSQIKDFLIPKLKASGWYGPLRMWLMGSEFTRVLEVLSEEVSMGFRMTPRFKDLFKFLELCPYDKLKVLIHTDELCEHVNQYTGLAFSQDISLRANNCLKNIFEELKRGDPNYSCNVNLDRWAMQGVLMVPMALSTTIGVRDAHNELWKSFLNTLFDLIKYDHPDLVCAFVGEKCWSRAETLKDHIVFKYEHPQKRFPEPWQPGMFEKINEELIKKGKEPIEW